MLIHLLDLDFLSGRVAARGILRICGAPLAGVPTACYTLWRHSYALYPFRSSAGGTECAFEISLRTPTAGEFLVALCLCLCTITACNWRPTCRLWDDALWWQAFFIVLVSAVHCVVSL